MGSGPLLGLLGSRARLLPAWGLGLQDIHIHNGLCNGTADVVCSAYMVQPQGGAAARWHSAEVQGRPSGLCPAQGHTRPRALLGAVQPMFSSQTLLLYLKYLFK